MEDAVTNTMLGGKTGNLAEEGFWFFVSGFWFSNFLRFLDSIWAINFMPIVNFGSGYPLLLRHNAATQTISGVFATIPQPIINGTNGQQTRN